MQAVTGALHEPAVVAALVAAGASFVTLGVTYLSQKKTRDQAKKRASAEYYRRQLDELYGELLILRKTSRRLWDRLRGGEERFRLIDRIEEIQAESSPKRREIVEKVLEINERIADLMEGKASLFVELPPADTFLQFLDHKRALDSLWRQGRNGNGSEPSFPKYLDDDIQHAIDQIQSRLREVEGEYHGTGEERP